MSCASQIDRTLLFRVASGTKLLGVSSNRDLEGLLPQLLYPLQIPCHCSRDLYKKQLNSAKIKQNYVIFLKVPRKR